MLIGAHVRHENPLAAARETGSEVVQIFLGDPQSWKVPPPYTWADELRESDLELFVHSPYMINVASLNNRVRIPSRKAVAQQVTGAAALGAKGVVVHGGHVRQGEDMAEGLANWRKMFERKAAEGGFEVPVLIENTAGGDNAMARELDTIARLWDEVGEFGAGFCLDTCHAFAAGWELDSVVDKVKAITGRIDLLHLNNSRDEFGSARDRHANVVHGGGTIDPDLLAEVAAQAGAPVVVETAAEGQADDIAFLREATAR
ncbi:deoxyribonuclease-4 [Amycolatopsis marina]|uniref:Deoxyribonuclease-4 n=1 Tax=Amycolatopsis marina TaxID=490629 RepID=A0A1I0VVD3_9PSEU|nr:deoxyribonuclease IV [Amycolatopsis marina]SFA80274.1 deoxyribonuclease-4 [Amycolatopsis marina]